MLLMLSTSLTGCLPSLPNPISPIPISPNFSSHFALCRIAPYPFRPLPFCPFAISPNHIFAQLPFRPFANSPFADLPNAISPLYHFARSPLRQMLLCLYHLAPLSFHHSVSVSLKLLTTAHDFLVLEPKQLPGTG